MIVGPPESMSKSKKNTIDPEIMINQYGADAVRWFILSDSPPEKDVQWSDAGVVSSNKFLQKIWNLTNLVINRSEKEEISKSKNIFINEIDKIIYKIDKTIDEFKFNVTIKHTFMKYLIFLNKNISSNISNKSFKDNLIKVLKLMIPFTPHLAHECLEILNCKTTEKWPEIKGNLIEEVKFAIQVNGKTRDVLTIKKNIAKDEIDKIVRKKLKSKQKIY